MTLGQLTFGTGPRDWELSSAAGLVPALVGPPVAGAAVAARARRIPALVVSGSLSPGVLQCSQWALQDSNL